MTIEIEGKLIELKEPMCAKQLYLLMLKTAGICYAAAGLIILINWIIEKL